METEAKKSYKAIRWQLVDTATRQLISLGVFALLSRLLEPKDFGLVGMATIVVSILTVLSDAGIGTALLQKKTLSGDQLQSGFVFGLATSISIAGVTSILSGKIAYLFNDERVAPVLIACSLTLPINALCAVQSTILLRELNLRAVAIRSIAASIVGGSVGVTLAFCGYGVWALVAQQLSSAFVSSLFTWLLSSWKPSLKLTFAGVRDLAPVGAAVLGNGILWAITSRTDRYFVAHQLGAESLGKYTIALRFPELLTAAVVTPIAKVLSIPITRQTSGKAESSALLASSMLILSSLITPIFVGFSCLAPQIIVFIFGAKWDYSSHLSALLALSALTTNLTVFLSPLMLSAGKTNAFTRCVLINAIGTVIVSYFCVRINMETMILTQLAFTFLLSLGTLIWLHRSNILDLPTFFSSCRPSLLSSFIMAAVVLLSNKLVPISTPALKLSILIPAGAITYIVTYYILDNTRFRETLQALQALVPLKLKRT